MIIVYKEASYYAYPFLLVSCRLRRFLYNHIRLSKTWGDRRQHVGFFPYRKGLRRKGSYLFVEPIRPLREGIHCLLHLPFLRLVLDRTQDLRL